jgi:hypothetical protein
MLLQPCDWERQIKRVAMSMGPYVGMLHQLLGVHGIHKDSL